MVVQWVLPCRSNPKYSGIQGFNKDSLGFLSVRFHKLAVVQRHVCCPLYSKAKWHSTHWVRGLTDAGEGMGGRGQVDWSDCHPASAQHLLNSWPDEHSGLLKASSP